jgi:integrase/recombinase XerD
MKERMAGRLAAAPDVETTRLMTPSSELDWRGAFDDLEGAYAAATLRAYRADYKIFADWCAAAGRASTPTTPELVAQFVAADAARSASSTLKRRLCAIRKVHRLLRLPNPVDNECVALALRRALRAKRRRPKQAGPVNAQLRDQLIAACATDLQGLRDRAMIAVGYDTLCRRSELVDLRADDLVQLAGGGARVLIRRAKNDPFGDGRWGFLSASAAAHLQQWLDVAGIRCGPMFRPLHNGRLIERHLHPIAVNRRLKAAAARAGLGPDAVRQLSGHSMRVGAAQDLMSAGRDLLQIMTAGGWTSANVVGRYVSNAQVNIWAP